MASRRNLKKEIGYNVAELFVDCLLCKTFIPGVDAEKADQAMASLLDSQDEFIARVQRPNAKEPKQVKAYYKKLRADWAAKVDELIAEISALTK